MNPILRDIAIGRRLARNGLRISRSTRAPYPWERLARYHAVSAAINPDLYCTVAGVQPARSVVLPDTAHFETPSLPATGQQAPTPTKRAKRRGGKA